MPIGNIYSGKSIVYGILPATAFGTGMADNSAAKQLSCKSFVINPDTKHRTPDRQTPGQNWHDSADVWNDRKASMVSCQIAMPALKNELALWLYLVMQKVTEVATTPFQKTFIFQSPSPDFTNNAGCFATLWAKAQVAATSEKIDALVGQKLELSLSANENEGNLFCNLGLIGKGFHRDANPSGTWTRVANSLFNFHNLARCSLDGNTLVITSIKLTIDGDIVPVGSDGAGNWQGVSYTVRKAGAELIALWDSNTRTALTNLDSGAKTEFIFGWGATGVDGFLNFTLNAKLSDAKPAEEDVRKVSISLDGVSEISSSTDMLKAEIADAVDWNW